jgi:hypothetical protein
MCLSGFLAICKFISLSFLILFVGLTLYVFLWACWQAVFKSLICFYWSGSPFGNLLVYLSVCQAGNLSACPPGRLRENTRQITIFTCQQSASWSGGRSFSIWQPYRLFCVCLDVCLSGLVVCILPFISSEWVRYEDFMFSLQQNRKGSAGYRSEFLFLRRGVVGGG